MDFEAVKQANIKWLNKKFKKLSPAEVEIKARKMTEKYFENNIEKINKHKEENQKIFDDSIDKELLYETLFGIE